MPQLSVKPRESETAAARPASPDRIFFPAMGLLILAIVGIGYGPRIFLPGFFHLQIDSTIIRIHVALVSMWLCVFAVQVLLAATGRFALHRRVGLWGFRLAAVWVVSALLALAGLMHKIPDSAPEGFILLTRISLFAAFLFMAWRARRQPAEHKRWMILAFSQAIIGGIRQLPIPGLQGDHARSMLVALLFPAVSVAWDLLTRRRLYRATLWGGLTILVVHLVRVPISTTAAWLAVAHWIGALGL